MNKQDSIDEFVEKILYKYGYRRNDKRDWEGTIEIINKTRKEASLQLIQEFQVQIAANIKDNVDYLVLSKWLSEKEKQLKQ